MRKVALLTMAFAATVPAANLMIANVGTTCIPQGPCLIPVGFGLTAPSGVLLVGLALVLRDLVHEAGGAKAAIFAIFLGGLVSAAFATPALLLASVSAFLLAETADLAVYTPLRKRRLWAAVLFSGVAGAFIDSAVFLFLAFGSLDFITGQVVGKLWMTLLSIPVLHFHHRYVSERVQ